MLKTLLLDKISNNMLFTCLSVRLFVQTVTVILTSNETQSSPILVLLSLYFRIAKHTHKPHTSNQNLKFPTTR